MVFIYIIELEQNKYYVGKTANPHFRLTQHFNASTTAWTSKYKPKRILEIINNCDNFDEDKYTIKYMEKYGINNVRGGSFVQIILSESNVQTIKQMINGSTKKCFICGDPSHFARNCLKKENKKIIINEQCNCINSFFSKHRKSKCLLKVVMKFFDNENDGVETIKSIFVDDSDNER